MTSYPAPLLPTTISLVLDYISPPSLLSFLPPHLISIPLAQRHRFLHITPDNPADYLAWPSDSLPNVQQTAIDLLECPIHDTVYTIRYTSDLESTFAHAAISTENPPGLRLVFLWHPPGGWKFHNLALMPFPSDSFESIQDMMVQKPHHFLDEPSLALIDDAERDSYWDAYGLSDDDDDHSRLGNAKLDPEPGTEDAYWAQYSAVHGSGDSARPTPPTVNRKLDAERIDMEYPHRTSSVYNPLAPPSPSALARRLANISPRTPSPAFFNDSDSGFGSASGSDDSPSGPVSTLSRPSMFLSSVTYTPSLQTSSNNSPMPHYSLDVNDEARNAVKEAIRGVYRLWKAGRVIDSSSHSDHDEFFEIVRLAVAQT